MRWFKHFTDNHRGRSIQTLMDRMGHSGLAIYLLQEICAEKIAKQGGQEFTDSDFVFSFHPRVLDNALRMKRKSTENILRISQECGLLTFEHSENEIKISMPILLDLLEYDQKKFRPRRATVPPKFRLDNNRIDNSSNIEPETVTAAEVIEEKESSNLVELGSVKNISATQSFENRFKDDGQKIMAFLSAENFWSLKKYTGHILEFYGAAEKFLADLNRIANQKNCPSKTVDPQGHQAYLSAAVLRQIGVMRDRGVNE